MDGGYTDAIAMEVSWYASAACDKFFLQPIAKVTWAVLLRSHYAQTAVHGSICSPSTTAFSGIGMVLNITCGADHPMVQPLVPMSRYLLVPLLWNFFYQIVLAGETHHINGTVSFAEIPAAPVSSPEIQGLLIAHGIICALGFGLCLPGGAILARYLRTSRPWWYTGHWIAQFGLGGPIIVVGVVLGYAASHKIGKTPKDGHKGLGTVILGLYVIQCAIGAIIHFFKPKNAKRRPIQNYFHAVFGLAVIALGMYQIHTGYDEEWPRYSGLGELPNGVNVLWYIWFILMVVAYAAGLLLFLRIQYTQEATGRRYSAAPSVANGTNQYGMNAMGRV
ncbi:CBD9-like protein [Mycena venus]|uniref:CBD9-like protein n=1 Tax=Mycena venus TaxID=2733690 RepID=A0A8H6YX25_9AGAR|nr:CBD9-like protein [Mycena venus]